jgi:putative SOS response-associated peptidase YedK
MCYDIHTTLKTQLKRAQRYTPELVPEIEEKIRPYQEQIKLEWYHASGFAHPIVLIYTNEAPFEPVPAQWGLIPHWSKDITSAKKFWNNTLNARGESIFEKPSFRDAAKHKRCLIYVDGFFEHHHKNQQTYPYYFHRNDGEPMILGGLWSEWVDQESGEILKTFSIVTKRGNETFATIHNNPKLNEPRMPLILDGSATKEWLDTNKGAEALNSLLAPEPHPEIEYHTVHKLRGKEAIGNVPEAVEPYVYDELNTLF